MKRFEVQFLGCHSCGGDHWYAVDTVGEYKPEGWGPKDVAEKLAQDLNEQWEKVRPK